MIRHTASRRSDTVSDAVGCMRAFGSIFVLTGTGALAVGILGWAGMDAAAWWERLGVMAIGAGHLGGGLAIGWGRSVHSVVRRAGVEWVERRPLRASRRRALPPSAVQSVGIESERDSDGDDHYSVVLVLQTGERLALTRQGTPSPEAAGEIADAVAQRLGTARSEHARGLLSPSSSGAESASVVARAPQAVGSAG